MAYNPKTKVFSGPVQAVDYTPAAALNAGDPVVINGVVYWAETDIAANTSGALIFSAGVMAGNKAAGAWTNGDEVYWNATATPNVGTASSGAYENNAAGGGYFVGYAVCSPGTTAGALTGDQLGYFVRAIAKAPAGSNVIADPGAAGAIPVSNSGTVNLTTAAAETRTLAVPAAAGISLILNAYSVGAGTATVNSATGNVGHSANTHIALAANGVSIELYSIAATGGAFRWAVRYNDGATLS